MTRGVITPVYERLIELLSDGEWHDGRTVLLEAGKVITPGVAQRVTEMLRARQRPDKGDEGYEPPAERQRYMPLGKQIEAGKRKMLTDQVRAKVRNGTFEMDPPWPLNGGLFDANRPWRLRMLKSIHHLSAPQVGNRLGVTAHVVKTVAVKEGLPYTNVGSSDRVVLQINAEDLPLYEKAVEKWMGTAEERERARTQRGSETRVAANVRVYLNERLGPSKEPVSQRIKALVDELEQLRRTNETLREALQRRR